MRFGNGDGTFGTSSIVPLANYSKLIVAGDFDGDGVADLATSGTTASSDKVLTVLLNQPTVILGDVNLDYEVNLLDVGPFVDILANSKFLPQADVNQDGAVDLLDVTPFVDLLSGG